MALQNVFSLTNTNISQADQTFLQGLANLGQRTGVTGDGVSVASFSIPDLFTNKIVSNLSTYTVYYIKPGANKKYKDMRGKCYIPCYNPDGYNSIDYFDDHLDQLYANTSVLSIDDTSILIDNDSHSINIYGAGVSSINNVIIEHESDTSWVYCFICQGSTSSSNFILIEKVDTSNEPSIEYAYKIEKNTSSQLSANKYVYSYSNENGGTSHKVKQSYASQELYNAITDYISAYKADKYGTYGDMKCSLDNLVSMILTSYGETIQYVNFDTIFGSDINKTFVEIRNIYNSTYFESDYAINKQIVYNLCKSLQNTVAIECEDYFKIFIPAKFKFSFLCNDNSTYIQPYCSIDNIYIYYLNIEGIFTSQKFLEKLSLIDSKDTSSNNYIYVYTYDENNKTDRISFYNFTAQYDDLSIGKCFSYVDLSLKYTLPYINNNNWVINGLNSNINTLSTYNYIPNVICIENDAIVFPKGVISELSGCLTKQIVYMRSYTDTDVAYISTGNYLNMRTDALEITTLNAKVMSDDLRETYKNTLLICKTSIKDAITETFLKAMYGDDAYITTFWGYNESTSSFEQLSTPLLSSYGVQNLMNYYINELASKINEISLYYKSLAVSNYFQLGEVQTEIKNNSNTNEKTIVSTYFMHQDDNTTTGTSNKLKLDIIDKSIDDKSSSWLDPTNIATIPDYVIHPNVGTSNINYTIGDNVPEINFEHQLLSNINAINRLNVISIHQPISNSVAYYGYIGMSYESHNASIMTIGTSESVPNMGEYLIDKDDQNKFKKQTDLNLNFNRVNINNTITANSSSNIILTKAKLVPKDASSTIGMSIKLYSSSYTQNSYTNHIYSNLRSDVSIESTTYINKNAYTSNILPKQGNYNIGTSPDRYSYAYLSNAVIKNLCIQKLDADTYPADSYNRNEKTRRTYIDLNSDLIVNGTYISGSNGHIGEMSIPFGEAYISKLYPNTIIPNDDTNTVYVEFSKPSHSLDVTYNNNKILSISPGEKINNILIGDANYSRYTSVILNKVNVSGNTVNIGNKTSYINTSFINKSFVKITYIENLFGSNDNVTIKSNAKFEKPIYSSDKLYIGDLHNKHDKVDNNPGVYGISANDGLSSKTRYYIQDYDKGIEITGTNSDAYVKASYFVGPAASLKNITYVALTYTDAATNSKTYTRTKINYDSDTLEINTDPTVSYLGSYVDSICKNYINPNIGVNIVHKVSYIYNDDTLTSLMNNTNLSESERNYWKTAYNDKFLHGMVGYKYEQSYDNENNPKSYKINSWDSTVNLDIDNNYAEESNKANISNQTYELLPAINTSDSGAQLNNKFNIKSFGAYKEDHAGFPTLIPLADVSRLYYKLQYVYYNGTTSYKKETYSNFSEFNITWVKEGTSDYNTYIKYKQIIGNNVTFVNTLTVGNIYELEDYSTSKYTGEDNFKVKNYNTFYKKIDKSGNATYLNYIESNVLAYSQKGSNAYPQYEMTTDYSRPVKYAISLDASKYTRNYAPYIDMTNYIWKCPVIIQEGAYKSTLNNKINTFSEEEFKSNFFGYIGQYKPIYKIDYIDDKGITGGSAQGGVNIGQLSMIGNIFGLRDNGNKAGTDNAKITIKLGYNLRYNILKTDNKLFEPQIIKMYNLKDENHFCETTENGVTHGLYGLSSTGDFNVTPSYTKIVIDIDHYIKYVCIPSKYQNIYIKGKSSTIGKLTGTNPTDDQTTNDFYSFDQIFGGSTFNNSTYSDNYNSFKSTIFNISGKNDLSDVDFYSLENIPAQSVDSNGNIETKNINVLLSISYELIEYYNKIFFGVTTVYSKNNEGKYTELNNLTSHTYTHDSVSITAVSNNLTDAGDFYIQDTSSFGNIEEGTAPPIYLLVLKSYASAHVIKFEGIYNNELETYSKNPTDIAKFAAKHNLYLTQNEKYIKAYPLNYRIGYDNGKLTDKGNWYNTLSGYCPTDYNNTGFKSNGQNGVDYVDYKIICHGILEMNNYYKWTSARLPSYGLIKTHEINQSVYGDTFTINAIPSGETKIISCESGQSVPTSNTYKDSIGVSLRYMARTAMNEIYKDINDGNIYMFYKVGDTSTGYHMLMLNLHAFALQLGIYDMVSNNLMYGGIFAESYNVEYYPMSATDGLFNGNCYVDGKIGKLGNIKGLLNSPLYYPGSDYMYAHNRNGYHTYGSSLKEFGLWLGKTLTVDENYLKYKSYYMPYYPNYGTYNHPITVTVRHEFNETTNSIKLRIMLDEF